MQGVKVGHFTSATHPTGVSVFLFDQPAAAACTVCGSSPASHELNVLDLEGFVPAIDGLMLTGGSAFGLSAVAGVMQWLREQGRGYRTPTTAVPIVPAAGIYDLGINTSLVSPSAENAYDACKHAIENNLQQGRIGAGAGASVGKLIPEAACMSGGLGWAEITLAKGVSVVAYAVVNSAGDVRDANGQIVAGAVWSDKQFADCQQYLLTGQEARASDGENTTLVAVFTNAKFARPELKRIAKVAISGMAHAISPVFTRYDGDTLFAVSVGEYAAPEMTVSVMAAEAVRQAIVNAVSKSMML